MRRLLFILAAMALAGGTTVAESATFQGQAQSPVKSPAASQKPDEVKKPGPSTTAKKAPARKSSSARKPRAQNVPTADRIKEIQAALAREGFYPAEPNGKWDAASVAAMKKFQEARGFTSTGKIDARSLQALGLGSDTAGLAPPVEPAASTVPNGPPSRR